MSLNAGDTMGPTRLCMRRGVGAGACLLCPHAAGPDFIEYLSITEGRWPVTKKSNAL
jgi:hypothetical protein